LRCCRLARTSAPDKFEGQKRANQHASKKPGERPCPRNAAKAEHSDEELHNSL